MVPVLVCPVLNRYDLLWRMLSSIDADVGTLFIVDNGGGLERDDVLEATTCSADTRLVDVGANLGVAMSWNLAIVATMESPWWCFIGGDVELARGDLARLAETMDAADGPLVACFDGAWSVVAFNAEAIEKVGWFDPWFYPAYCEDTDWRHRARLLGVPEVSIPTSTRHLEGGSVAIRQPGTDNAKSYPQNVEHTWRKWGGPPHGEVWPHPFGDENVLPTTVTLPPLSRLRGLAW